MDRYKIAVITTEVIQPYVEETLSSLSLNCDPQFYPYDPLKGMESVYRQLPPYIQGILTCGTRFATALEELAGKEQRSIVPICTDDAALHRLLWQLHLEKNLQDFSRVYCDFLDNLHLEVMDFLTIDQGTSLSASMNQNSALLGRDKDFQYTEDMHYCKLLSIWETGKFDYIITRYSGLIPLLRREGVQVFYPYPSISTVRAACEDLLKEIEILNLQKTQPAEIHFKIQAPVPGEESANRFDQQCMLLQNALMGFFSDSALEVVFRRCHFGISVLADRKTVGRCTQEHTSCIISDYLAKCLDFKVVVGYGIGSNMYYAKLNAIDAVREGELMGGSYIVNEKQELIGPLGKSTMLTVPTFSNTHSCDLKDSGLSSLTVMKVLTAIQNTPDEQITARELALKLSVTHRSANHFLSSMEKVGILCVITTQRLTTRGRPERVYGQTSRGNTPH